MKKCFKTGLCLILVLSLLSTMLCGFAAEGENDLVYVSLGDSIADGIGLPANPRRGPDTEDKTLVYCNKTAGAYPTLAAEQLGIADNNFYQLACAGMRSVELRYCLDQSYVMPNKDANNFQNNELQEWVLSRFDYVELVKKADIVTMNMCANDIATCALFHVRAAMASSGVSTSQLDALTESEISSGEYFGALGTLLDYASTLESYAGIAAAAVEGISEGYSIWTENWDAICKRIYELNPDVQLICLGMYNPFSEMKLSDSTLLPIGAALSGVVSAINAWSAAGSAYADRYTYVSIMGIESMFAEQGKTFTDDDLLTNLELNVHPSVKGQCQIAERVVAAVNLSETPVQAAVDLGLSGAKKSVASVSRTVTKAISKLASLFH